MKRHRITNALSIVSVLLCVATAGMWIRSYWRFDSFFAGKVWGEFNIPVAVVDTWSIDTPAGSILFLREQSPKAADVDWVSEHIPNKFRGHDVSGSDTLQNHTYVDPHGGFVWFYQRADLRRGSHFILQLAIPFYSLFIAFSALPALRLAKRLCRRRLRAGFCSSCGYDLRATPDRCPECGKAQNAAARAAARI